jgi:hypothetical protein
MDQHCRIQLYYSRTNEPSESNQKSRSRWKTPRVHQVFHCVQRHSPRIHENIHPAYKSRVIAGSRSKTCIKRWRDARGKLGMIHCSGQSSIASDSEELHPLVRCHEIHILMFSRSWRLCVLTHRIRWFHSIHVTSRIALEIVLKNSKWIKKPTKLVICSECCQRWSDWLP